MTPPTRKTVPKTNEDEDKGSPFSDKEDGEVSDAEHASATADSDLENESGKPFNHRSGESAITNLGLDVGVIAPDTADDVTEDDSQVLGVTPKTMNDETNDSGPARSASPIVSRASVARSYATKSTSTKSSKNDEAKGTDEQPTETSASQPSNDSSEKEDAAEQLADISISKPAAKKKEKPEIDINKAWNASTLKAKSNILGMLKHLEKHKNLCPNWESFRGQTGDNIATECVRIGQVYRSNLTAATVQAQAGSKRTRDDADASYDDTEGHRSKKVKMKASVADATTIAQERGITYKGRKIKQMRK